MKPFNYLVAENLQAALDEYAGGKCALKAGGVDLVDRMKEHLEAPETVLSIGAVKDLDYIREDNGAIKIGCLATLAELGRNDLLKQKATALYECAGNTATPQVRERATIGGNVNQRPQCWYFRHIEFPCLKKAGPTCFAPDGENQYHAIFGGGPCHIVHPSNNAPVLVAMDAEFKIQKAGGERMVKSADYFVLPRENLMKENVLDRGEILTEIVIPGTVEKSAVIELREKQSFDWPMVTAAVARVGGRWRVCLGHVAPKPWLAEAANQLLGNKEITAQLAREAGEAAATDAAPLDDNAYKVPLVKVAVRRALMAAAGLEAQG